MRPRRLFVRAVGAGMAVAAIAALTACSSSGSNNSGGSGGGGGGSTGGSGSGGGGLPGTGKPPIVMGDKNFAEQYLLGALYQQALQAKGYKVTLKGNIGSSTVIDKALTSGKIQWYPEYTGVIYTELAHLGDRPKSAKVTYEGAKQWESKRGFAMLNPTPFQDADGIATLKPYANKYHLKTIADLKNIPHFTYGGPPENKTRYQGVVGLNQAYGLHNFTFLPLQIGAQYQALDQGKVNTIAIFTTDGQLASGKYSVLTDTKGIFGYQQVAPVVKKSLLTAEGPAFAQTLNKVSSLLTIPAIVSMNKAVQIDQKNPATVAKQFLQANHLVSG
jgi:osmoprotectant transport system substrate-binding protein